MREKETGLICVHEVLIEVQPKREPKQEILYFLKKETINLWAIDKTKKLRFWVLN